MSDEQQPAGTAASANRRTKGNPAWIPGIDEQLIARFDRLKSELGVEKQAHDDGFRNLPASDDVEMNEMQLRIRDTAVQKIALLYTFLSNQLGIVIGNLIDDGDRLDLSNRKLEVDAVFGRALLEGSRQLVRTGEELAAAEQGLKYFVARNQLSRPPHYVESLWLVGTSLFALLVIESFLNGYILKDISERGWSGGVALAMIISAVNVMLGVVGGAVGWRLVGHRFALPKTIGWVFTLSTLAAAATWNVLIAHYRQLAEESIRNLSAQGSIFDSATSWDTATATAGIEPSTNAASDLFRGAWQHMQEAGWLNLDAVWSWILLAVGGVVFLCACLKGWNDLDRYWDYRKFDLRRRNVEDDFELECIQATDVIAARLDDCLKQCRTSVQQIEAQAAENEIVIDLAEQRKVEVLNSETDWMNEANRLLRFYREENRKVCSNSVPQYWNSYPTVAEYRELLARSAEGGAGILERVNMQLATIRRKRKMIPEIVAANKAALAQLEGFIINLKAKVPGKVKELRTAAREQAARIVADRVYTET